MCLVDLSLSPSMLPVPTLHHRPQNAASADWSGWPGNLAVQSKAFVARGDTKLCITRLIARPLHCYMGNRLNHHPYGGRPFKSIYLATFRGCFFINLLWLHLILSNGLSVLPVMCVNYMGLLQEWCLEHKVCIVQLHY